MIDYEHHVSFSLVKWIDHSIAVHKVIVMLFIISNNTVQLLHQPLKIKTNVCSWVYNVQ